jgi:hypothetical protein
LRLPSCCAWAETADWVKEASRHRKLFGDSSARRRAQHHVPVNSTSSPQPVGTSTVSTYAQSQSPRRREYRGFLTAATRRFPSDASFRHGDAWPTHERRALARLGWRRSRFLGQPPRLLTRLDLVIIALARPSFVANSKHHHPEQHQWKYPAGANAPVRRRRQQRTRPEDQSEAVKQRPNQSIRRCRMRPMPQQTSEMRRWSTMFPM